MKHAHSLLLLTVSGLAGLGTARAQDAAKAADGGADKNRMALTKLVEALDGMARLPSIAFKTTESQDAAMTRRFAGMMGGNDEVSVQGTLREGLLGARAGDDEFVLYRGRMVARGEDDKWQLRHQVNAEGTPMPFVLDPQLFCEVMASELGKQGKVLRVGTETVGDKEMTVVTVHFDGAAAHSLTLCGAMPRIKGGPVLMLGPGGHMPMPKGEHQADLAFVFDPEQKLVHKVRVKAYEESNLPGNIKIQVGGPGGVAEEDEEEEEKDDAKDAAKNAEPVFKKGLPERKLTKKLSLCEFGVTFTDHGKAKAADLPAQARALLKLAEVR